MARYKFTRSNPLTIGRDDRGDPLKNIQKMLDDITTIAEELKKRKEKRNKSENQQPENQQPENQQPEGQQPDSDTTDDSKATDADARNIKRMATHRQAENDSILNNTTFLDDSKKSGDTISIEAGAAFDYKDWKDFPGILDTNSDTYAFNKQAKDQFEGSGNPLFKKSWKNIEYSHHVLNDNKLDHYSRMIKTQQTDTNSKLQAFSNPNTDSIANTLSQDDTTTSNVTAPKSDTGTVVEEPKINELDTVETADVGTAEVSDTEVIAEPDTTSSEAIEIDPNTSDAVADIVQQVDTSNMIDKLPTNQLSNLFGN